jgi:transcription elongation factor GreA-like protein
MTVSDLKLKIFRQIDSLEKSRLEEFYGVLMNYVNGKKDISDWDKLSDTQKQGILDAIDELDSKKGVSNKVVINKFRKKYSND